MPSSRVTIATGLPDAATGGDIDRDLDFAALRHDLEVPTGFPAGARAEAAEAASTAVDSGPAVESGSAGAAGPASVGPAAVGCDRVDRTDIDFVTVDPPGARDLDQAVHIAPAAGGGYVFSYAIADVAAFVAPGGALDTESARRGETLYFPDARVPLYPPELSEGAASLLPNQVRPAVLWQITLDPAGAATSTTVARAWVRSRRQLDYAELQAELDHGRTPEAVALLGEVGTRRLALARARRAIALDLPEQEVDRDAAGRWHLHLRQQLPVEQWNAEISLLTGISAADIMLRGGVGLLRTLPEPDPGTVEHLRRVAPALGVDWPPGAEAGDVLARLNRSDPRHVAFVEHAASLLRGAGYTAFDGAPFVAFGNGAPPMRIEHAGVGAPYAHVTAPLRRLVDRYGTEVCLALHAGHPVPDWARAALPALPAIMRGADQRAHAIDRAVLDSVEAWLLRARIGDTFDAVVLDAGPRSARIAIDEPAVRATCAGADLVEGARIRVRLTEADVASRTVRFAAVDPGRQE